MQDQERRTIRELRLERERRGLGGPTVYLCLVVESNGCISTIPITAVEERWGHQDSTAVVNVIGGSGMKRTSG